MLLHDMAFISTFRLDLIRCSEHRTGMENPAFRCCGDGRNAVMVSHWLSSWRL